MSITHDSLTRRCIGDTLPQRSDVREQNVRSERRKVLFRPTSMDIQFRESLHAARIPIYGTLDRSAIESIRPALPRAGSRHGRVSFTPGSF